ncbi:NmrA-like family domain-containing protein 1 [Talaromyces pinophilus]|nr:NmrA-like family domain-containing protein 1 [Talaromyces pinophilus]
MSEIITVFGATGNQGGSVVDAILNDPALSSRFMIRAVTRDASKPAAKELAAKDGVEVVTADLSSPTSVHDAISGAHTVFLVTDFWQQASLPAEVQQGKNVTDACKAAGVQHLIFSSLIDVKEASKGSLVHVYHFDGKAEIERYIRDSGVPATFILAGVFATEMRRLINWQGDKYVLALPVDEDAQIPLIDIRQDMGLFVKAAIKNRSSVLAQKIYASAAYYTPQQIVDDFSAVIEKPAVFMKISEQVFKSFIEEEKAQELYETVMLFQKDMGYYAGADLSESLKLLGDEKPTEWKDYAAKNLEQWL